MSDLTAVNAKNLSDTAVLKATIVATQVFTDATQVAIQAAASAQAYSVNVAVPGGVNIDSITKFFQRLGYTIEWLTNNTSLTLDWQNPNVPNTVPSTPSTNAIP